MSCMSSRVPKPEVVAELKRAGHKIDYIQADMQDRAAPAKLIADTVALAGKLDILVNNAGVAQHGDTHTFPAEQYDRLMEINLHSLFRACQAALEPMMQQKSGVILNIGSISGYISNIPQPQAAYNASKAAVHMLTKSLASDYAARGHPGQRHRSRLYRHRHDLRRLSDPEWGPIWRADDAAADGGHRRRHRRCGTYLCSDASRYVTGEVLVIDGGYTVR